MSLKKTFSLVLCIAATMLLLSSCGQEPGGNTAEKAPIPDGVYSADPKKDPKAVKYDTLTYSEALSKGLKIMDASALSMCLDNKISTLVFDLHIPGNIKNALTGQKIGTVIMP